MSTDCNFVVHVFEDWQLVSAVMSTNQVRIVRSKLSQKGRNELPYVSGINGHHR